MSRTHLKLVDTAPPRTDWHEFGCRCERCEPRVPSVPAQLTTATICKLTFAGIVVGNAIAFAIDPHGASRALLATIGL